MNKKEEKSLRNQVKELLETLNLNSEDLDKLILPIDIKLRLLNLSVAEMSNNKEVVCLIYFLLDEETRKQFKDLLKKYIEKGRFDINKSAMKNFLECIEKEFKEKYKNIDECLNEFEDIHFEEVLKEVAYLKNS